MLVDFDKDIRVSISGTQMKTGNKGKPFLVYVISVEVLAKCNVYHVQRRYSEFRKLARNLKKLYPKVKMPKLPAKVMGKKMSSKDVAKRWTSLQSYLTALMLVPALNRCDLLCRFFETDQIRHLARRSTNSAAMAITSQSIKPISETAISKRKPGLQERRSRSVRASKNIVTRMAEDDTDDFGTFCIHLVKEDDNSTTDGVVEEEEEELDCSTFRIYSPENTPRLTKANSSGDLSQQLSARNEITSNRGAGGGLINPFCYREPDTWEANLISFEKGEWTEEMNLAGDAFRRYAPKVRRGIPSVMVRAAPAPNESGLKVELC